MWDHWYKIEVACLKTIDIDSSLGRWSSLPNNTYEDVNVEVNYKGSN